MCLACSEVVVDHLVCFMAVRTEWQADFLPILCSTLQWNMTSSQLSKEGGCHRGRSCVSCLKFCGQYGGVDSMEMLAPQ